SYVLDQSKLPLLREWTGDADPRVTGQLVYEDLVTDMRERIGDIVTPLTVVYPWNERYPTRAQAEPFYRSNYAALSHARFAGIGPAAHFVMTDQPAAFQRALTEFLEDYPGTLYPAPRRTPRRRGSIRYDAGVRHSGAWRAPVGNRRHPMAVHPRVSIIS